MTFLEPNLAASIYAAGIGLTLLVLAILKPSWAQDKGGYVDTWHTVDKAQHLGISFALAGLAILIGVGYWLAFVLTVVAGVLFEFVEGHKSWKDIVADSVGALLATVIAMYFQL